MKLPPPALCLLWSSGGWVACRPIPPKDRPPATGSTAADSGLLNRAPTAPLLSIQPPEPATGDPLRFQVEQAPVDPDGDPLTWTILWSVDGQEAPEWSDSVPADATQKGQVWELRASVSDGQLHSEVNLAVVVIGNTEPTATVTLQPDTPTTLDSLRAVPSGTDPDGDPIGYRLVWLLNGEVTDHTAPDIPADATRAGETWTVVVTPSDPATNGPATTGSVVVLNSVPTVSRLRITPDDPTVEDTITAEYETDDPDPDDLLTARFVWTVDGVATDTDTGLSPGSFVRGQEIGLSISLDDGTVEGPPRYADPVTVGNSPPEVLSAWITPAEPTPEDTVSCSGVGWSDADGDPEAYEVIWSLNGSPGPSTEQWDLSPLGATGGETLQCILVPHDGLEPGPSRAHTVTLAPS